MGMGKMCCSGGEYVDGVIITKMLIFLLQLSDRNVIMLVRQTKGRDEHGKTT